MLPFSYKHGRFQCFCEFTAFPPELILLLLYIRGDFMATAWLNMSYQCKSLYFHMLVPVYYTLFNDVWTQTYHCFQLCLFWIISISKLLSFFCVSAVAKVKFCYDGFFRETLQTLASELAHLQHYHFTQNNDWTLNCPIHVNLFLKVLQDISRDVYFSMYRSL